MDEHDESIGDFARGDPGMIETLRRSLVGEVRALFNDASKGQAPVERSADALIPPGSVAWRVHGDVTTMMVGGVAALLTQMLHPSALAGVVDHSRFPEDALGRLRGTARFIALTTYAPRAQGEQAIATIRRIHDRVNGTRLDGVAYDANDPRLLAWVHVAGALPFLDAWRRYGEPLMSRADQDRYFAEVAPVARALGADPVPRTRAEAEALLVSFRGELAVDDRTRAVNHAIVNAPPPRLRAAPAQALVTRAGIDLMPGWARAMHGLTSPMLARPLLQGSAFSLASTLRWAFAAEARA